MIGGDPSALRTLAAALRDAGTEVQDAMTGGDVTVSGLVGHGLQGQTAAAFGARWAAVHTMGAQLATTADRAGGAISTFATALESAQRSERAAHATADTHRITIDGFSAWPPPRTEEGSGDLGVGVALVSVRTLLDEAETGVRQARSILQHALGGLRSDLAAFTRHADSLPFAPLLKAAEIFLDAWGKPAEAVKAMDELVEKVFGLASHAGSDMHSDVAEVRSAAASILSRAGKRAKALDEELDEIQDVADRFRGTGLMATTVGDVFKGIDDVPILRDVPVVGVAVSFLTTLFDHYVEGDTWGDAVGKNASALGGSVLGVAGGSALAASALGEGGALAALGEIGGVAALGPVGAGLVVGVVAGYGAEWAWDHRQAIGREAEAAATDVGHATEATYHAVDDAASTVANAASDVGKAAEHAADTVVHDLDPLNW